MIWHFHKLRHTLDLFPVVCSPGGLLHMPLEAMTVFLISIMFTLEAIKWLRPTFLLLLVWEIQSYTWMLLWYFAGVWGKTLLSFMTSWSFSPIFVQAIPFLFSTRQDGPFLLFSMQCTYMLPNFNYVCAVCIQMGQIVFDKLVYDN